MLDFSDRTRTGISILPLDISRWLANDLLLTNHKIYKTKQMNGLHYFTDIVSGRSVSLITFGDITAGFICNLLNNMRSTTFFAFIAKTEKENE